LFLNLEKHRINIIGGLILVVLTLAAGISVFVVMQRQAEAKLGKSLEAARQSNVRLFESQIDQALSNTWTMTTRPFLIQNLQLLESEPGNATGRAELQRIAQSLPPTVFTGFSFYDVRGHEVARAGLFSQQHDLRVPLKSNNRAFLLWDGKFILHASMDVLDQQGRRIGTVKTEANLPLLTAAFTDIASIGKTGEFAMCAPLADDEMNMDCFLSRISGKDFKRLARVVEGKALPMNHALNGQTGIIQAKDYRREVVIAAYAPMGSLGLGMVIKIDQAELYSLVTEQLKFIVPLLAALVLVGMLLLHVLVRPLVRNLVDSERASRDANTLLRDSEARFTNIINLAADAIISVDEDQRILIFNQGAERIFGYTAAEMLGQALEKLLPERYAEAHRGHLRQFATAPQATQLMNYRSDIFGRRKDGSEFFAEGNISRAMENGRLIFTMFLRDITQQQEQKEALRQLNAELETKVLLRTAELEQAKAEAEQASRAKSEFLSTMSHEIRTPMNGVIGMVDVLQQTSLDGHQLEMVETIRDSAFSLLAIIDDILDFSKIEAGKLEIEQVPTSVAEVVEKACGMLDHLALKKGVELTLFTDPALPAQILGDAARLRQVLVNLANNAIKFSSGQGRQGHVAVRAVLAAREAGKVVIDIHITDNGIGMDEATQARLFSSFTQADASTTRRFGGTGLGLAIARNLAELMGGNIRVQSAPGEGASFTLRLPCVPVTETPGSAAGEVHPLLAGLSCLAVGSADGLADDLAAYLVAAGARVERAPDLAAAGAHPGPTAPGPWVWLIDAGSAPPAPDALRALIDAHTAQHLNCVIVVGRGKRRLPRRQGADPRVFEIDANVLTRHSVENVVAIAAGHRSAKVDAPPTGKSAALLAAPPRADALRQGRLLLVAEDNETNQKVIVQQLALLGYAADVAADGSEALERWLSGDYALLLTDLHMPHMDGYELAAAIRDHEAGQRRIPIIALTANVLKDEAEHCRAVGMDDYLSKPAQLVDLKAMLAKWLPAGAVSPAPTFGAGGTPTMSPAPTSPKGAGRHEVAVPSHARDGATPHTFATLDVSVLAALVGDDPETIREFLLDFRASAATIAAELQAAVAAGDAARAGALAHKLKSSARSVGALALGGLCGEMEAAGKAGDTAMLKIFILKFVDEMTAVAAALERLTSRHKNNDDREE
jgi:PAS domain S-box-containing protein